MARKAYLTAHSTRVRMADLYGNEGEEMQQVATENQGSTVGPEVVEEKW